MTEHIINQTLQKNFHGKDDWNHCLNQFKEYGIIKAVKVSSDKIYFDTNLKEHHHFFCQESEKLTDIKTDHVKISKLPKLPKGKKLKSIEVIINITE